LFPKILFRVHCGWFFVKKTVFTDGNHQKWVCCLQRTPAI
jgi:hypothetical protein